MGDEITESLSRNVSITFAYKMRKARTIPTHNGNVRIVNIDHSTERNVPYRVNCNRHECSKESAQVVRICNDIERFVYDCFRRSDRNKRD